MTTRPPAAEVVFVCEHCGTSRTSRTLAREIKLKCAGCGLATSHGIAGLREEGHLQPWGRHDDWREGANRREQSKLRRAVFVEQFLTAAGVEVCDNGSSRELSHNNDDRARRLFAVARDRRRGDRWIVEVANDATLDGRIAALQDAARWILCDERLDAEGEYIGYAVSAKNPAHLQEDGGE